jgi:transposase
MSKTFRPWHVDDVWLLPASIHDFVPAGHVAHLIREVVRSEIDLSAIVSAYEQEARGAPPYHPGMMVALVLYAYSQGVYSSRRIARGCEERLDFAAVTGMQCPDFRTVSDFRKLHLEALKGLFVEVLQLCREAGLAKLGHVALDGTKIKANASKHKAMSYGRMVEAEPKLAAEVEEWMKKAGQTDAAEDGEHGGQRRGDEMPEWVANKQKRLAKIREAKAALEAEARAAEKNGLADGGDAGGPAGEAAAAKPADKAQRNFTDAESRIMKTKDGFIQGYNAQAAVDASSQVIVAQDLSQNGSDKQQMGPMLAAIEAANGGNPEQLSADAGYCSEDSLGKLSERAIDGYVATGRQKHGAADAAGENQGKPGTRTQAMRDKLRQGGFDGPYRLRKQTVEPVFGQIKQARGFRQFLLRGFAKARAKWSLLCTVHNLLKLVAERRRLQLPVVAAG